MNPASPSYGTAAAVHRLYPQPRFFIGLDLGQARDFTAIAILDRSAQPTGQRDPLTMQWTWNTRRHLRFLERLPLGTSYPDIVRHVRDIVTDPQVAGRCDLIVDATGVGAPVVDLLRASRLGCALVPVQITAGDRAHRDRGVWKVPKRELIVGLQLLLQQGSLEIAKGLPCGSTLVEELREMRVSFTPAGHETYSAWRSSQHDDLVLATALAAWKS